jgi:beta-glucosidase
MDLTGDQNELIRAVAAVNPRTIVVVNAGSIVSMDWAGDVAAIVQVWYPGQELGNALADVLFGKVDPSGRLPTTVPVHFEDNPAHDNYPGADGIVRYEEGVFVGYRHYDDNDIEPRFVFGHGLSYTTFAYGDLRYDGGTATVDVTNTGDRPGSEVVQLYVSDLASSVPRPPKELKGFVKLSLEPGETKTARIALGERAFQFWHDGRWTLEPGEFELLCGSSSRDIRARARITL